jgi:hypothetical protein
MQYLCVRVGLSDLERLNCFHDAPRRSNHSPPVIDRMDEAKTEPLSAKLDKIRSPNLESQKQVS